MFFEFPPMPVAFAQRLILLVAFKFCSLYPHSQVSDLARLELPLPPPSLPSRLPAPTGTVFLQPTPTTVLKTARALGPLEFSTIVIFTAVAIAILLGTLLHLSEVAFTTVYRFFIRPAGGVSTESGLLLGPPGNASTYETITGHNIEETLAVNDCYSVLSNPSDSEPTFTSDTHLADSHSTESGLSGPSASTPANETLPPDEIQENPSSDDTVLHSLSNTVSTNTRTSDAEPVTTLESIGLDLQHLSASTSPSNAEPSFILSLEDQTSEPTIAIPNSQDPHETVVSARVSSAMTLLSIVTHIEQDDTSEESTIISSPSDAELALTLSNTVPSDLHDNVPASMNAPNANAEPITISETFSSSSTFEYEPISSTMAHSHGNTGLQHLRQESNTEQQIVSNVPVPVVHNDTAESGPRPATSTVTLVSTPHDDNPELTTPPNHLNGEEMGTAMHNVQERSTTLHVQDNVNSSNTEPSTTSGTTGVTSNVADLSVDETAIDTANVESENPSREADIHDDPPIMPLPTFILPYTPSHPRWKFMIDILAFAVRNYEFKTSQTLRTTEIEFLLNIIYKFEHKCTALRIENRHFKRQNGRLRREVVPPTYDQALREGAFDEWSAAAVSGAATFAPPQRSDYSRNESEGNLSRLTGPPPDYTRTDTHPRTEH